MGTGTTSPYLKNTVKVAPAVLCVPRSSSNSEDVPFTHFDAPSTVNSLVSIAFWDCMFSSESAFRPHVDYGHVRPVCSLQGDMTSIFCYHQDIIPSHRMKINQIRKHIPHPTSYTLAPTNFLSNIAPLAIWSDSEVLVLTITPTFLNSLPCERTISCIRLSASASAFLLWGEE